jgi:hypothetical protein
MLTPSHSIIIDNKLKAINLTDGGKSYRIVAKKKVDGHTQIMNILKKKILDDFDNKNLYTEYDVFHIFGELIFTLIVMDKSLK